MDERFLFHTEPSPEWPKCLNELMADFTDRRGLGQMWDSLDDVVREEIMKKWKGLIETATNSSAAVDAIIDDLSDRSGFDHEWDAIDGDIKEEIKQEWKGILDRSK